jgi:hypothetical protein
MPWSEAEAATAVQRIARGRYARQGTERKRVHTLVGTELLTMLEGVRLYHDSVVMSARVAHNLDRLPELVPSLSREYDMERRTEAAKEVALVLCEVQGDNADKAFRLVQTSSVAHFAVQLAREVLAPPNTSVLYPLFAILSNLPSLGGQQGEELLKTSGAFELLVDSLYSPDAGVQYYAVAAVSNMSHDLEANELIKKKKATAQASSPYCRL